MAHSSSVFQAFGAVLSIALLGGTSLGIASGCGTQVVSGTDKETDTDDTDTDTDTDDTDTTCTTYAGDGCTPGATESCNDGFGGAAASPSMSCALVPGKTCTTAWQYMDCDTPLVLSFDGAPVEYVSGGSRGFDINGSRSQLLDWPTARTPWLALDRDHNGAIDDGSELFGSMTSLRDGGHARNGFLALRELDTNGDGRITSEDAGFAELALWADDRTSPLGARGIVSIDLDYTSDARCDAHGNCEVERASFVWSDATGALHTGAIVDIHLAPQSF